MKLFLTLFISTVFISVGISQNEFEITLKGQIFNTDSDTLKLLQNDGSANKLIAAIQLDEKGHFSEKLTLTDKDYYVLQLEDEQRINIIIEGQEKIELYSDGKNLFHYSNFINSDVSNDLLNVLRVNTVYRNKLDSVKAYLQANKGQAQQIQQSFQPVYEQFLNNRAHFIRSNANSPALIGVLSTFNIKDEFESYEKVVQQLNEGFGESPTIKRIYAQYEKNKTLLAAQQPIPLGSLAKDIAQPTPEGDTLRLSDYKGNYILLDFWASWCGPCRKENPNVVAAYHKYKEEGFIVFSVSLDKSKDRWVQAIKQDGLVWDTHVSDLKSWNSAPAQKYKVHSIPQSFLIDKEGKIIDSNLRGEGLEAKLKEIYGY